MSGVEGWWDWAAQATEDYLSNPPYPVRPNEHSGYYSGHEADSDREREAGPVVEDQQREETRGLGTCIRGSGGVSCRGLHPGGCCCGDTSEGHHGGCRHQADTAPRNHPREAVDTTTDVRYSEQHKGVEEAPGLGTPGPHSHRENPTKEQPSMTTTSIDRRPGDMLDALTGHQPTRDEAGAILAFFLPLVAAASPVNEGWDQARRELSAALHWDLNLNTFEEAVEYGDTLARILDGEDLTLMFGPGRGYTGDWTREVLADHYRDILSHKINQLVSGIER